MDLLAEGLLLVSLKSTADLPFCFSSDRIGPEFVAVLQRKGGITVCASTWECMEPSLPGREQ